VQPTALAAAITGAVSGETLQLASSCRYVLTAPLPAVSQDLTIQGRKATLERSPLPATAQFGILTVAAGNLAVSQLNFRNGYGGAITFDPLTTGSLSVTGGSFTGNTGGAINFGQFATGGLSVTRSAFTRNTGGAINATWSNYGATLTGTTFTGNTGGAVNYSSFSGALTVTGDTFTGNSATAAGGGIVNPAAFGTVTLTDSQVRGNSARSSGGAIYTSGPRSVTLTGSLVQANRPDNCAPADSVPGCTG
jgi:predicted outer membrane repeat protein